MIRTQGYDGGYFILESEGGVTPISKRSFDVINQQNNEITKKDKQLQQYKSLVKTVDADNLPSDMVWAWCDEGLYLGYIEFNDTYEALIIKAYLETYDEPTHYIEQKDLIKMISGDL